MPAVRRRATSDNDYLLVKKEALEQKNTADLIAGLKRATFRSLVNAIPGYDVCKVGVVKTIGEVT